MAQGANQVQLDPQTLAAFDAYIHQVETESKHPEQESALFLWSDADSERARQVRAGQVLAQFWSGRGPVKVPSGLIHDWIAAAFIPESTIPEILGVIQDYDNHKNIYKPEVLDSKLISRQDDDFQIYLRLLKKKIITVVLDTDHEVHYRPAGPNRWVCWSRTTRVAEVEHAGGGDERVLPPDTGYGFLWRLYSYWRFEQRDADVVVECRAISLTRNVPTGLGWAIEPIIQKLPKDSLIHTLEATQQALNTRPK